MSSGSGDRLASGAVRAQFGPAEKVTDDKWNSIFADFDPEKYRGNTNPKNENVGIKSRNIGKFPNGD